jgi:hypothetical protein
MSALSREALALIERARTGDAPSASDRDRMRAKLSKELGAAAFAGVALGSAAVASSPGSSATAASTGSAPATGSGLAGAAAQHGALFGIAKIALATLVMGTLGLGGLVLFADEHGKPGAKRAPGAPAQPLAMPAEPPVEAVAPAPAVLEPAPSEALAVPVTVQPRRAARPRAAANVQSTPSEPQPTALPDASSLRAELALISRAQLALRQGHADQALSALREHETLFAQGSLREERLGLLAMAECAQGKDGAQVLRAFSAAAPHSPILRRVREACTKK